MRRIYAFLLVCLFLLLSACAGCRQENRTGDYHKIVIASDVHYITKITDPQVRWQKQQQKQAAMKAINGWQDVELVVFLGDFVEKYGHAADYERAKKFYGQCTQPKTIIAGNHELLYNDQEDENGRMTRTNPETRKQRQQLFLKSFDQKELYYTKNMGRYLLIFLAPDKLDSKYLVEFSPEEMAWLQQKLENNKTKPILIFCHAPLAGTLANYNEAVNTVNFVAQPAGKLEKLLLKYPNIKLWVSGHTHTPVNNESFANQKQNTFKGKILNLHNPSWENKEICVNSIYLYEDRLEIKTYNLDRKMAMPQFDRVIKLEK